MCRAWGRRSPSLQSTSFVVFAKIMFLALLIDTFWPSRACYLSYTRIYHQYRGLTESLHFLIYLCVYVFVFFRFLMNTSPGLKTANSLQATRSSIRHQVHFHRHSYSRKCRSIFFSDIPEQLEININTFVVVLQSVITFGSES